jgi:GNAT superfamily N-acetyltransferase
VSRTTAPLTVDHLAALDLPCQDCLFWELDPVQRQRLTDQQTCIGVKESWVSEVLREWGSCGRVALVDDEVVGYLCYAPPAYFPGAEAFPTAPVSPDAVLLSTGRVADEHAGGGLGRMLVQGMAGDLAGRPGIRAVEVFADQQGAGRCLLPAEFLARVGFKTHRPHPRTPRMRMELRTLVTWRTEVEAALEKLVGVVRPAKPPAPAAPASRDDLEPGRWISIRGSRPRSPVAPLLDLPG